VVRDSSSQELIIVRGVDFGSYVLAMAFLESTTFGREKRRQRHEVI
jgi:hypothetical protein